MAGKRMATRPGQYPASPVALVRAVVNDLAAYRLQIRAFPLQDGPSAYLQT